MGAENYDVIVIGGGLLGCFAARSLTRYNLKVALLEKCEDLCTGVSRANTAIVYSGCEMKPDMMKTAMCIRASQGFAQLCEELGVRYSPCGSIMICFGERGADFLRKKYSDGVNYGVRGIRLLTRVEVLELEPNISENVHSGLFIPDTGTVMPWELCFAAAENAVRNGAEIILNAEVIKINSLGIGGYEVWTSQGKFYTHSIVNCAGLMADNVHKMVESLSVRLMPTAADFFVLDTKAFGHIKHVIIHETEEKGKGLTLVPTVDGNILVGPTERPCSAIHNSQNTIHKTQSAIYNSQYAIYNSQYAIHNTQSAIHNTHSSQFSIHDYNGLYEVIHNRQCFEGFETAHEGFAELCELISEVMPTLSTESIIRSFGAVRPKACHLDSNKSINKFIISEAGAEAPFISLIGIKTPGMTCANELGQLVADKIGTRLNAELNPDFDPRRLSPIKLSGLSFEERAAVVQDNPDYGRIICRCRGVSEGEVLDSVARFPGAVTPDGVKRRTGAGGGRCQGGFCGQRVEATLITAGGEGRAKIIATGGEGKAKIIAAGGEGRAKIIAAGGEERAKHNSGFQIKDYDVIVIGGGPAGMAAALGAASCDVKPHVLIIEREETLGGILNQCKHSGFGLTYFGEDLTGQEYARRFVELIESSTVEVFTDTMVLDISVDGIITISSKKTGFTQIWAKAVVLATGCRERPIGALPVAGTRPSGVFAAGAAQKMINIEGCDIGNRFVILGSGDVGMIVARELALRGKEIVAVIEKEDKCGGLPHNRINCLERFGIPLMLNSTVSEVHGASRVSGVTIVTVNDGNFELGTWNPEFMRFGCTASDSARNSEFGFRNSELNKFIECDTIITSVGLIPERELLDGFIAGTLPKWLFLCGNACFVHDIVDDVTVEAERTGRLAAGVTVEAERKGRLAADVAVTAVGTTSAERRAESGELGNIGDLGDVENTEDIGEIGNEVINIGRVRNVGEVRNAESIEDVARVLCIACPKNCSVTRDGTGWQGLACGRSEPQL